MISGAVEYLFLSTLRAEELRMTTENLLKCLNFLGNYSLTAGEITMILGQVSRSVEAVSYTHLDVYKRQGSWRMHSLFRLISM